MASDAEPVSAADLAKHTGEDDCWLTIHGKVYNVTKYLMDHPGGMDVMLEHAGALQPLCGMLTALVCVSVRSRRAVACITWHAADLCR